MSGEAYSALRLPAPQQLLTQARTLALPDTGAQLTVGGPSLLRTLHWGLRSKN